MKCAIIAFETEIEAELCMDHGNLAGSALVLVLLGPHLYMDRIAIVRIPCAGAAAPCGSVSVIEWAARQQEGQPRGSIVDAVGEQVLNALQDASHMMRIRIDAALQAGGVVNAHSVIVGAGTLQETFGSSWEAHSWRERGWQKEHGWQEECSWQEQGCSMHFINVPFSAIIQEEEWICVNSAPGAGHSGKGGSHGGKQGGQGNVVASDGGAGEHGSEVGKGANGEHGSQGGKGAAEHGSEGGKGADNEHCGKGGKGGIGKHGSKGSKGGIGEHGSKGGIGHGRGGIGEHSSRGGKGVIVPSPPDSSLRDASHELAHNMDTIAVAAAVLTRGRSRTPPRSPARSYYRH